MTLAQDVRTVKDWCRSAKRRTVHQGEVGVAVVKAWSSSSVPPALKATDKHDYVPETGSCTCGNPTGESYREHLLLVLDAASFLKTPAYVTGEGW